MGILTLKDILETRDFIDFEVGGNVGIVKGKIVESTPIPTADGYSIIAWANQLADWKSDSKRIIMKFGSFYPIEAYKERETERNRRGGKGDVFNFDLFLEKDRSGIYRFGPKGRTSGGSFHYSGDGDSYERYFQRLTQEELALR
jgi:hypothetical protein